MDDGRTLIWGVKQTLSNYYLLIFQTKKGQLSPNLFINNYENLPNAIN